MNKKLLSSKLFFALFAFSLAYSASLKAQDIIILNNGEEFKSKVDEVLDTEIKYFKWENLNGPKYSIKKTDVFMIRYQSGFVENYSKNKSTETKVVRNDSNKFSKNTDEVWDDNLRYSIYYNSGTSSLINNGNLIGDFSLSNLPNEYIDLGLGFDNRLSENSFWGLGIVFGAQIYAVDKAYFYRQLKSTLSSGEFISDWYIDDNLVMGKVGIQSTYTKTDKTNQHRFKLLFSLSNMMVGDFNYSCLYNNMGTIYINGSSGNSISLETAMKYEHRLYKKLGIEFNFGITVTPMSTSWRGSNNVNSLTTLSNYNYGLFQIKMGSGLLFY